MPIRASSCPISPYKTPPPRTKESTATFLPRCTPTPAPLARLSLLPPPPGQLSLIETSTSPTEGVARAGPFGKEQRTGPFRRRPRSHAGRTKPADTQIKSRKNPPPPRSQWTIRRTCTYCFTRYVPSFKNIPKFDDVQQLMKSIAMASVANRLPKNRNTNFA